MVVDNSISSQVDFIGSPTNQPHNPPPFCLLYYMTNQQPCIKERVIYTTYFDFVYFDNHLILSLNGEISLRNCLEFFWSHHLPKKKLEEF